MIELFLEHLQKKPFNFSVGRLWNFSECICERYIQCQAVLIAKGGLVNAHFMRYVALILILYH